MFDKQYVINIIWYDLGLSFEWGTNRILEKIKLNFVMRINSWLYMFRWPLNNIEIPTNFIIRWIFEAMVRAKLFGAINARISEAYALCGWHNPNIILSKVINYYRSHKRARAIIYFQTRKSPNSSPYEEIFLLIHNWRV